MALCTHHHPWARPVDAQVALRSVSSTGGPAALPPSVGSSPSRRPYRWRTQISKRAAITGGPASAIAYRLGLPSHLAGTLGTAPHPPPVPAAERFPARVAASVAQRTILGPFCGHRIKVAPWKVGGFGRLPRGVSIRSCSDDRDCGRGHTKEAEQERTSVHVFSSCPELAVPRSGSS